MPPPAEGAFDELSKLIAFARDALSQLLELASLEGRRAAVGLVWMFVGGLLAAIFIVTAWTGLMAALAMTLVSLGMLPLATVIVVAAANLLAGAVLLYGCIGLSGRLLFPATRRQLAGESPTGSPAP